MYNTFTKAKSVFLIAFTASALLFAGTVSAGPAKPGTKMYAPGGNIVETASAANDLLDAFNTLLAAATCPYFEGAIVDALSGKGQRTLFAPTDAAFALLGLDDTNVCDAFNPEVSGEDAAGTPETLALILSYHVTAGRQFSHKIFSKDGSPREIEMLAGGTITTSNNQIIDNVPKAVDIFSSFFDIPASNGVIHVIDQVLIP